MEVESPSRGGRRAKVLAAAVLLLVVGYAVTRPASDTSFRATGEPVALPEAGELTDLSADQFEGVLVGLHGTPVIVNIWASWCAPCRTETPLLERAWRAHGDEVIIIGVASKDIASNSRDFMDEFEVSFPNVFDSSGEIRAQIGRAHV